MERQVIQSTGFRNIKEDGEIIGFQFKIRLPYYRGVYLSQLMPGTLYVDGECIGKENITWILNGEEYTNEQMEPGGTNDPAGQKARRPDAGIP